MLFFVILYQFKVQNSYFISITLLILKKLPLKLTENSFFFLYRGTSPSLIISLESRRKGL